MAKLSTGVLKQQITGWLSRPELKEGLRDHYVQDDDAQADIDQAAAALGLPMGSNADAVREAIWSLWCDGARQWKRTTKRRLGDDAGDYFYVVGVGQSAQPVSLFIEDLCGQQDAQLVKAVNAVPGGSARCWLRVFLPVNEQLADNFRLEVVTTPEDDAVVGWTVIVD